VLVLETMINCVGSKISDNRHFHRNLET
jgi:hypothetical protein